jgi:plasmid stabilization system protein ParE
MIGVTGAARHQIDNLVRFYIEEKLRPEAALRLLDDLDDARGMILAAPEKGRTFPSTYSGLSEFGFRWVRARAYWVAWVVIDDRPVVTNVFHVSADIEGRATPSVEDVADW